MFCDRHFERFVPESDGLMRGSYLILDEYRRLFDKVDGREKASDSTPVVGEESDELGKVGARYLCAKRWVL